MTDERRRFWVKDVFGKGKPERHEYWRETPLDFLVEDSEDAAGLQAKFQEQARLLDELILSCAYEKSVFKGGWCYQRVDDRRDVCVFEASNQGRPVLARPESFGDIPGQGSGLWAVAVFPSSAPMKQARYLTAKVALSQWLGYADGIEAVACVRASMLDMKRIGELEAAGIPVLFEFSGRLPGKQIIDPVGDALVQPSWTDKKFTFSGRIPAEKAAGLGPRLDRESLAEITRDVAREFGARVLDYRWQTAYDRAPKAISALTLGREKWGEEDSPDTGSSRGGAGSNSHWVFGVVDLSTDNLPTEGIAEMKKRICDISRIWVSQLFAYNLDLNPFEVEKRRPGTTVLERDEPDYSKFPELAEFLGVDSMIEAYYEGIPLEDILA